MNIEVVTLCDAATEQMGKLNILGAFDVIRTGDFPHIHPQCAFVTRIRYGYDDQGEKEFELFFTNQAGVNVMPPLKTRIVIEMNSEFNYRISNMILNMQRVRFADPGIYTIRLDCNGLPLTELELRVIDITPKEPNPLA
jgi:hypothetical protein